MARTASGLLYMRVVTWNVSGTSMEPPLPRRKKCPELAYRTHEFISNTAADGGGIDALDSNVVADKVRVSTAYLGVVLEEKHGAFRAI